ncbi:GMC family oxidoreductase [Henriciella aquimarina]|uniref:GMC family oxidoreductase n=1 Tax=Henriciella aquimarina TaxID=545261 RepID=UPI000A061E20|nr:GMC family oxidoreductase N-terminal domain-containing protein [Henriciella aquimarina]
MAGYDYVIVGAGAAGCVMANRLSENPDVRVALLEAGPRDTHPFIRMPKGIIKVMADPDHIWGYSSVPEETNDNTPEFWVRGRVLGGSSSINGMMYVRGQPADFDAIAEVSSQDWDWNHIGAAYAALESHQLGTGETRGGSGPLKVTLPDIKDTITNAMLEAGKAMGWKEKADTNAPDDIEGIGYAPRTIHKGRRQSAATAFLDPIRSRDNLDIMTGCTVDRVIFDGKRAVAVDVVRDGQKSRIETRGEIILCGGALASPNILERSGIGDPERLEALGLDVLHANPNVGENLIEHRAILIQWKLNKDISHNRKYHGLGMLLAGMQYYLTRSGPMSAASYEQVAWFKTRPGLNRPDAQLLFAPFSFDFDKQRQDVERHPGIHVCAYPLRPTSKGHVHITSVDLDAAPELQTNYRDTEEDRRAMIGTVRTAREWARQQPLAQYIEAETMPGPAYESDEDILKAYDRFGTCAYHAVGTCRMGADAETSVVDPKLRVRGVDGLRIIDTSIMPMIPSGNTNGPTMAMAWRAADLILQDAKTSEPA